MYRYPNLWTPGTETNSYTPEELDAAPTDALARLAVFNADRETGADPILHFLNMPFDDKYREGAPQTQLEALTAAQAKFEKQHPQAMLQSLGHRAAAMLVLMDRIRGVETVNPQSDDYILNTGYVRIPDLGRRSVDGDSIVGYVDSNGGRLELDGSSGSASPNGGVGLVAGLKELDPQASKLFCSLSSFCARLSLSVCVVPKAGLGSVKHCKPQPTTKFEHFAPRGLTYYV